MNFDHRSRAFIKNVSNYGYKRTDVLEIISISGSVLFVRTEEASFEG